MINKMSMVFVFFNMVLFFSTAQDLESYNRTDYSPLPDAVLYLPVESDEFYNHTAAWNYLFADVYGDQILINHGSCFSYSEDFGINWKHIFLNNDLGTNSYHEVVVRDNFFAASSYRGLILSPDYGRNWYYLETEQGPSPENISGHGITGDLTFLVPERSTDLISNIYADNEFFYAVFSGKGVLKYNLKSEEWEFFKSDDIWMYKEWEEIKFFINGDEESYCSAEMEYRFDKEIYGAHLIDVSRDGDDFYLMCSNGIYASHDFGRSWHLVRRQKIFYGKFLEVGGGILHYWERAGTRRAVRSGDPRVELYAGYYDGNFVTSYYTEDYGSTWQVDQDDQEVAKKIFTYRSSEDRALVLGHQFAFIKGENDRVLYEINAMAHSEPTSFPLGLNAEFSDRYIYGTTPSRPGIYYSRERDSRWYGLFPRTPDGFIFGETVFNDGIVYIVQNHSVYLFDIDFRIGRIEHIRKYDFPETPHIFKDGSSVLVYSDQTLHAIHENGRTPLWSVAEENSLPGDFELTRLYGTTSGFVAIQDNSSRLDTEVYFVGPSGVIPIYSEILDENGIRAFGLSIRDVVSLEGSVFLVFHPRRDGIFIIKVDQLGQHSLLYHWTDGAGLGIPNMTTIDGRVVLTNTRISRIFDPEGQMTQAVDVSDELTYRVPIGLNRYKVNSRDFSDSLASHSSFYAIRPYQLINLSSRAEMILDNSSILNPWASDSEITVLSASFFDQEIIRDSDRIDLEVEYGIADFVPEKEYSLRLYSSDKDGNNIMSFHRQSLQRATGTVTVSCRLHLSRRISNEAQIKVEIVEVLSRNSTMGIVSTKHDVKVGF